MKKVALLSMIGPLALFPAYLLAMFGLLLHSSITGVFYKQNVEEAIGLSFLYAGVGYFFALLVVALFGIPTFLILKKYEIYNVASVLITSLIPSIVIYLASLSETLFVFLAYSSVAVALACYILELRLSEQ
jgi:hypothetical protein